MSYDTFNNPAFVDQQFNITDLNYDGTSTTHTGKFPKVNAIDANGHTYPLEIHKQNSFAYLRYDLGNKNIYVDPYYHSVADKNTISSDYYNVLGDPTVITPASHPSSVLSNFGEYDVYTLNNVSSSRFGALAALGGATKISLAIGAPAFDPQILLYNATGTTLLASVHGSALQYSLTPNTKYQLVISGYLGDTAGAYTVNMSTVPPAATLGAISSFAKSNTPFSKTLLSGKNSSALTALIG